MTKALEQLRQAARLVCYATNAAYGATLRGDIPAGSFRNFDPVIGRPVVEITTIGAWDNPGRVTPRTPDLLDCVGTLDRIEQEPVFSQEEWNEGGDGPDVPIPLEAAYYVRTLDGREARWTNAKFVRVPDTFDFKAISDRAA